MNRRIRRDPNSRRRQRGQPSRRPASRFRRRYRSGVICLPTSPESSPTAHTMQMACRIELATGKLAEARHYVDAVTAMPYFREQRYIGLGRRFEVDAIAGDFDVVVANVELFDRDWRRAGRPVAADLAVGAYAAAMVYGMLGADTPAVDGSRSPATGSRHPSASSPTPTSGRSARRLPRPPPR